MKLSPEHTTLEEAIAAATLAAHLHRFRPVNAITYRRYQRVQPNQQPISRSAIPKLATTYAPLLSSDGQADFVAYRALLSEITTRVSNSYNYCFESVPLLFDTGASVSCTFNRHDFISPIRPVQPMTIQGIASSLTVKGIGTVQYTLPTTTGTTTSIIIHDVLFVPDCPSRLICPRQLLHHLDDPEASLQCNSTSVQLSFRGSIIDIPYDDQLNIPILHTAPGVDSYLSFCQATGNSHSAPPPSLPSLPPVAAAGILTPNLTPGQQIKRKLHERYSHRAYSRINAWILDGTIDVPKSIAKEPDPVCAICQLAKARRQSHKGHRGSITANDVKPGDGVSADQMEATVPGLLPTTKGAPTNRRYLYCNFWVDHFSDFIFVTIRDKARSRTHQI